MLAKHSKEQLKFFVVREPIVGDENDEECEEVGWDEERQNLVTKVQKLNLFQFRFY